MHLYVADYTGKPVRKNSRHTEKGNYAWLLVRECGHVPVLLTGSVGPAVCQARISAGSR